jgi:CTP synthase
VQEPDRGLRHGNVANETRVNLRWVDAETVEKEGAERHLDGVDGLMVPGGFGTRGIEGKIASIRYARERGVPFFGICLCMQCAVIEFARNVLGLAGANSSEFDPKRRTRSSTCCPSSTASPTRRHDTAEFLPLHARGGLSRGGLRTERRFRSATATASFNNACRDHSGGGLLPSGIYPGGTLVEIIELPRHPWFLGCQFHPEFKSALGAHPSSGSS